MKVDVIYLNADRFDIGFCAGADAGDDDHGRVTGIDHKFDRPTVVLFENGDDGQPVRAIAISGTLEQLEMFSSNVWQAAEWVERIYVNVSQGQYRLSGLGDV